MKRKLFIVFASVGLAACSNQSNVQPLYHSQEMNVPKSFKVELPIELPETAIKPLKIQSWLKKIFGKIPLLSEIVQMPFELAMSIIPPQTTSFYSDMSMTQDLEDPEVLKKLTSLKITSGFINVVQEEAHPYEANSGLGFLQELQVLLTFPEATPTDSKGKKVPEYAVVIGQGKIDPKNGLTRLDLKMTELDLKPFLQKYGSYKVKVVAKGKLPSHIVTIGGRFYADLQIQP